MQRIPEPELMDDPEQALAYARADFSVSHGARLGIFRELFPQLELTGAVLDLGCGSGDVLLRFARAFPRASFFGIDGSQPMLALAREALDREPELEARVQFNHGIIPDSSLPNESWQLIMSHSLLHQLHVPQVLWRTVRDYGKRGCAVFVHDLRRPESELAARQLVASSSQHEPPILQRDFFNSLCAAFEPQEVRAQLDEAGLAVLAVRQQEPYHLSAHGYL